MNMRTDSKMVKTGILVVLLLLILIPPLYRGVFESMPFKSADATGIEYVDKAFDRALIAFALARATNAIISVIQDSEIDIAPAGVGVTIAIGEALDPINDMIERFSWVMLVSLVSLGIQKLLIDISPWISIKLILLPSLLLILGGVWINRAWGERCRYYGVRLLFLAVLIRFCIPAVAVVNDQIYNLFLDQHYTTAVSGIEQGNVALRSMDPLSDDYRSKDPDGFWGEIRKKAEKIGAIVDLQHRISRMKSRLAGMIENLLKMIAVFILNTVLLPIGFLWLLVRLFRLFTGGDSLHNLERLVMAKMAGGEPVTVAAAAGSETVQPGRDGDEAEIDEEHKNVKTDE